METSYLKDYPLGNHYPEWTPNLHADHSQDSNPCARGSQGPQSASRSTGFIYLMTFTAPYSFLGPIAPKVLFPLSPMRKAFGSWEIKYE